jgi:hypothetical protein
MYQLKRTIGRIVFPFLGFFGATILAPTVPAVAQEVTDTAGITISGNVYDSRTFGRVVDAQVRFSETDYSAVSDENGAFRLERVELGRYLMVVTAPGYQELRVHLQVERSGDLSIPLEPLVGPEESPRTNPVIGRVREADSSRPIEGAEVVLSGARGFQVTDPEGRFEFPSVPQGPATITIRRMGREPMTDEVDVSGEGTLELDIRLAPDPVELEPMVVTVTRRVPYLEDMGFYERQEKGYSGQHITREYIDERDPRTMGDILQSVPGVRVDYDGLGSYFVQIRRPIRLTSGDGCIPRVLIDDVPADPGWLEDISPQRVEGIEVYTGVNAPLRYNNPCGVILVWTRRGQRRGGGDG